MIVDLTGDQFDKDPAVPVKCEKIFVGDMQDFHKQFRIVSREMSTGINSLGSGSWDRMYKLYDSIMKYME